MGNNRRETLNGDEAGLHQDADYPLDVSVRCNHCGGTVDVPGSEGDRVAKVTTDEKGNVMRPIEVRGPWDNEPDREEWRHVGLPCLIKRGPSGALCGYVGAPPGHPWHGKGTSSALCGDDGCYEHVIDPDVHGGLTYAAKCDGNEGEGICHVPQEGEPADVWWLGFDCAHSGDLMPSHYRTPEELAKWLGFGDTYKDMAYVRAEVERLAEQITAAV